ncbi:hypothetical protein HYW76_03575 [Candidatus Pacearchaeota archaeon]|nr:hypothetical protein [Candidatus Pacearchaeota archaeon]
MVKNNLSSKFIFATTIIIAFLISLNFVFAFTIESVTPSYLNRTSNTRVNITLNNTDNVNITQLTITLPFETTFYANTNRTTAGDSVFTNTTAGPQKILIWTNTSQLTFFPNNTVQSFLFNISLANLGNVMFTNFTLTAKHIAGADNITSYNFRVDFAFSGYTKNETGGTETNVNVSMYRVAAGAGGPPTESYESSILSDSNGQFTFPNINGSASLYKLKMIRYGLAAGCISSNSTCNVTKIGTSLPYFPAMMFYPATADLPIFEFMRPPSLNGTSFYMQPAATLRLYANNWSEGIAGSAQKFGYQVTDQVSGFPTESNFMTSVSTVDIAVPIDRNFTVMFVRTPGNGNFGFTFHSLCNGSLMNDTTCPTPPVSNSTLGVLSQGQILVVNQSFVTNTYRLFGCINMSAGTNNSALNITSFSLKMIPWPGFVPPFRADMGDIDLDVNINYTASSLGCAFAFYNISAMGSASGLNYLIEAYAKNKTAAPDVYSANAWSLAAFQNITITGNRNYNLTLFRLAGNYNSSSGVNTSKIKINIVNSSGGAITTNMNANVRIKHPVTGTLTYIIESMSSGSFYMSILNNSNWAKIMVYSNDAPPREVTLNLSQSEANITMTTMSDGRGVGMKKINSTGQMEMINSTQLNSSLAINMRFLRNSEACNVLIPADSCVITNTSAKNFNPLTALVAGKINMEMKITSTGVTLMFMNFDMFSAKQPPMESIMNDRASSGASSTNQVWQFGSFAPKDAYSYVVIAMPFDDAAINDSADMSLSTPMLYDENWNAVWNRSRGDTSVNLTDDFIDYNSTALYRNYLSSSGINCSKTDSNLNVTPCYINTTSNMVYMRIPHFSGVSPGVSGSAPSSSSTTTASGGGGSAVSFWATTYVPIDSQFVSGYTQTLAKASRVKIKVSSEDHYVGVVSLTNTSATINISSTPQQAVFNIGEEKKFDVDSNNYYDISVKLNSISLSKANLTIKTINELMPQSPATPAETPETPSTPVSDSVETIEQKSSLSMWITLILVIIVVLVVAAYLIYKKYN